MNNYIIKQMPEHWKYIPFLATDMAMTAFGVIYFPAAQYAELNSKSPSIWVQSVLEHEQVHAQRQYRLGKLYWGVKYILSKKFRLHEEVLAVKTQMQFLHAHGANYDIERKARQFASSEYLWVLSYQKARLLLTKLWDSSKILSQ